MRYRRGQVICLGSQGIIRTNDNAITDSDSQLIHDAREAIIESIFSPDHGLTPNEPERGYTS